VFLAPLAQLFHMPIPEWLSGVDYEPGAVVTYLGQVYQKLDDDDQGEPDISPIAWQLIQHTNLSEYQAIDQSLGSYEARREAHKAEVLAALKADGFAVDDVRAVLDAS